MTFPAEHPFAATITLAALAQWGVDVGDSDRAGDLSRNITAVDWCLRNKQLPGVPLLTVIAANPRWFLGVGGGDQGVWSAGHILALTATTWGHDHLLDMLSWAEAWTEQRITHWNTTRSRVAWSVLSVPPTLESAERELAMLINATLVLEPIEEDKDNT